MLNADRTQPPLNNPHSQAGSRVWAEGGNETIFHSTVSLLPL